jgi:restriction endonuclease Mrr
MIGSGELQQSPAPPGLLRSTQALPAHGLGSARERGFMATGGQERLRVAVPDFQTLMRPILVQLQDTVSHEQSATFEQHQRPRIPAFSRASCSMCSRPLGYGGSRADAANRLGQSGDGGVDGVIREDRLGLDQIYVQAKKWADPVGRPEIQRFFGALHGQRATKGVFITTSTFTRGARDYANDVTPRVILVDGIELAGLMIDYRVGVTPTETITLVRLDSDYFDADGNATVT